MKPKDDLRMLELFSGSKILSNTFKEIGFVVKTLDKFEDSDFKQDILEFDYRQFEKGYFNVIWSSPLCTCFSMASLSHHIEKVNDTFYPKTDYAFENYRYILRTWEIIMYLKPKYWFIENPKAIMKKLPFMPIPKEVWYCRYGDTRAKPTDIFTNCPIEFYKCSNENPFCNHIRSPRGSKTGTQGLKNSFERGKLPKELCIFVAKECKRLLNEI